MKKFLKGIIAIVIVLTIALSSTVVYAEPPEMPGGERPNANGGTTPDKQDGEGMPQGGENNSKWLVYVLKKCEN